MLTQLTITNFGLIDHATIEFTQPLTILTGETGAGKSIIIDALRYVLGERLSSSQIRTTSEPCTVEAVFDLPQATVREHAPFAEYLSTDDPTFIIVRTTTPDGRTKIKINGQTVTVSTLKDLGDHLVDFHGPNDHQLLLSSPAHLGIIDRLAAVHELMKTYTEHYRHYQDLKAQLATIQESAATRDRDLDLVAHQVQELEQVPLAEEHFEAVQHDYARISNTEKLYTTTQSLLELFENDLGGITDQLGNAYSLLKSLSTIDESMAPQLDALSAMQDTANELAASLRSYLETLSFEPHDTERITRMCDSYHNIKRKYGPTLDDARRYYEQAKKKYDLLINLEHNDKEIRAQLAQYTASLSTLAGKLTTVRTKTAAVLTKTIEQELKDLGIKHVQFECRFEHGELTATGHDVVTFYISPNAGEALKPLADIVSSGEAARLMLALKRALIKVDPIPVLIFDEIDAQIGGRLGTVIGTKLKTLAEHRQVILITHLPQIAAFADTHIKVSKNVTANHTTVAIAVLTNDGRIAELAAMMSGEQESSVAITHAKEMLKHAR